MSHNDFEGELRLVGLSLKLAPVLSALANSTPARPAPSSPNSAPPAAPIAQPNLSTGSDIAATPSPAAAAPADRPKAPSTAVTEDQLRVLRDHYKTWDHSISRTKEGCSRRKAIGKAVGVTPKIVSVKFGEFHRQARKAVIRAKKAANTNQA